MTTADVIATAEKSLGSTFLFRADQLEIADENVRSGTDKKTKKREVNAGIRELAALILSQGLLQNLIGYIPAGNKKNKKVQISAGGRRLTAINWLISEGKLTPEFEIAVKIVSEQEAHLKSMAENSGREEMHPADQFIAFQTAVNAGNSVEEISAAFGVDVLTVKRRLKLAQIEPSIFAQYQAGETTLDAITALTLADSHEQQLQVWTSLPANGRTSAAIKRLITTSEINAATDHVAQFVGLAAYREAGGRERKDLFSDMVTLCDVPLLESLATSKLEELSKGIESEDWAWVEINARVTSADLHNYFKAPFISRHMTEEEQQKLSELEQALEAAEDAKNNLYDQFEEAKDDDEDLTEDEEAQLEALGKIVEAAQEALDQYTDTFTIMHPAAKEFAGAIVYVGRHNNQMIIERAQIRAEDYKKFTQALDAHNKSQASDAKAEQAGTTQEETKSGHSEKLIQELTTQRTAALQYKLANNTPVALAALAAKLAEEVFGDNRFGQKMYSVMISTQRVDLTSTSDNIKDALAFDEMLSKRQEWLKILPLQGEENLFTWALKQESTTILSLLTFCTAALVNTVKSTEKRETSEVQLAAALQLDMTEFWEPTRQLYLSRIKKDQVVSLIAKEVSNDAALPMANLPKAELCDAAEKALTGKGWLPDVLKLPQ